MEMRRRTVRVTRGTVFYVRRCRIRRFGRFIPELFMIVFRPFLVDSVCAALCIVNVRRRIKDCIFGVPLIVSAGNGLIDCV